MRSVVRFLSAAMLIAVAFTATSQQIAHVDPTRFGKPEPICTIRGVEVRPVLQVIVSSLQSAKFQITQTNGDLGQAEAKVTDEEGENRVIVWLEWDIAKPGQQFKIFFVGARFVKFFGKTELQRLLLSATDEERYFGKVRTALISAAFNKG